MLRVDGIGGHMPNKVSKYVLMRPGALQAKMLQPRSLQKCMRFGSRHLLFAVIKFGHSRQYAASPLAQPQAVVAAKQKNGHLRLFAGGLIAFGGQGIALRRAQRVDGAKQAARGGG